MFKTQRILVHIVVWLVCALYFVTNSCIVIQASASFTRGFTFWVKTHQRWRTAKNRSGKVWWM